MSVPSGVQIASDGCASAFQGFYQSGTGIFESEGALIRPKLSDTQLGGTGYWVLGIRYWVFIPTVIYAVRWINILMCIK